MNNTKPVQIPTLIAGLSTKVDGSIKIVLETRELPPEASAQLFSMRGSEAWTVIAPTEMSEIAVPNERPDTALGTKSPSQRLRGVIYILWQQTNSGQDFESFYRTKLEAIIDQIKSRLE